VPLVGGEDFAEKLDFRAKSGVGSKVINTNFTTPPRNLKISPLPQGEVYQKFIRDSRVFTLRTTKLIPSPFFTKLSSTKLLINLTP